MEGGDSRDQPVFSWTELGLKSNSASWIEHSQQPQGSQILQFADGHFKLSCNPI